MEIKSRVFFSDNVAGARLELGIHGLVRADRDWHAEGMTIPYSKLYLVMDGEAFLRCAGKLTVLEAGHAYLVPYGALHDFYCETQMEKLYFHFAAPRPGGADLFSGVSDVRSTPVSRQRLERMKEMYLSDDVGALYGLKGELFRFASEFKKIYGIGEEPEPHYSDTVTAAVTFIRHNVSQALCLSKLSEKLFVSESTLSKRFSREMGMSVGQFIDREVMTEAQRRLLLSDEPLSVISERLGFCDQFYFSKKFRAYCGVSPSRYRASRRSGI